MDTLPDMSQAPDILELIKKRNERRELIESACIFDITKHTRDYGLSWKSQITSGLFRELYPFGEDAVKGITFTDRLDILLKKFKGKFKYSDKNLCEFLITFPTYVKRAESFDKVEVFSDGNSRDKRLRVYATSFILDERLQPTLTFGYIEGIFLHPDFG